MDYVKRVIGLPGDRIQMKEGRVYINDTPVRVERLNDFVGERACGPTSLSRVKRWKETLPNGVSYETLDCIDSRGFPDYTQVYEVPPGYYFLMSDNRDNSTDSRAPNAVGYVPFENLVGRVRLIYFSIREGENPSLISRWPQAVRWDRILKLVN